MTSLGSCAGLDETIAMFRAQVCHTYHAIKDYDDDDDDYADNNDDDADKGIKRQLCAEESLPSWSDTGI